ncbi:hypothetical protein [Deminuibacter soli]|uniref:Uncharacterized protein n=1 Tax=Deminuibacter soli TaxID=2291815 RepID=A0A3E1NCX7_9BACT|nr:hypothetical protein [Deminuibacter soli]RFM25712.1 hypothetical protein DXN05_23670 [Deminuibacter soli]
MNFNVPEFFYQGEKYFARVKADVIREQGTHRDARYDVEIFRSPHYPCGVLEIVETLEGGFNIKRNMLEGVSKFISRDIYRYISEQFD